MTTPVLPAIAVRGLVCLSLFTFAAITTEILPVGLLPLMSAGLGASEAQVGLVVTAYALLVAALSLPLTHWTAGLPRKPLLLTTVATYAVSNLVVGLAPSFWLVVAGRTLGGAAHAVFFSVVTAYASRLVPGPLMGRAVALTFAGTSLGYVLGVPAATFVGEAAGWRAAFLALAGLTVLLVLAAVVLLPPVTQAPHEHSGSAGSNRPLRLVGLANVTLFLGHYAAYTYISPYLLGAGMAVEHVAVALLLFGGAGVLGVGLAARTADRRPRGGLLLALGAMAAGLVGLLVLDPSVPGTLALVSVWSLGFGAVPSFFITAAMRLPGVRSDVAGAVVNATSNVGIAAGAGLGGLVLGVAGQRGLPLPSVVLVAVTVAVVLAAPGVFPRRPRFVEHATSREASDEPGSGSAQDNPRSAGPST